MGNKLSQEDLSEERLIKFDVTDINDDDFITMEEFENIYVTQTGYAPGWEDWKNFMICDVNKDFTISKKEFTEFFNRSE